MLTCTCTCLHALVRLAAVLTGTHGNVSAEENSFHNHASLLIMSRCLQNRQIRVRATDISVKSDKLIPHSLPDP